MTPIIVNQHGLINELATLATYSDVPSPAVTRIHFTPVELKARDYIRRLMREAGLDLREDAVGNIFGRWKGANPDLPAIATGSHIDAIPNSGRYDGTVGVLGGIEALRALKVSGFVSQRSLEVIMFTAEEPTRFGIGCLGSRALAGSLSPDRLRSLHDSEGCDFDKVRKAAGYTAPLHTVQLTKGFYHAFVELHIEQGAVLEREGREIGVVTAIAAPATLRLTLHGDGGHAGTVLMPQRRDAMAAAAEIILAVEQAARHSTSLDAVATVGLCQVYPGAVNSIPSRVLMEIDIRDIDLASRDMMVSYITMSIAHTCEARSLLYELLTLNADKPCYSGGDIVTGLVEIAQKRGYSYQTMVSRAYHDTLFMSEICPTSMSFVRSQNGYSHRPEEFTASEDIVRGVTVLAEILARLAS